MSRKWFPAILKTNTGRLLSTLTMSVCGKSRRISVSDFQPALREISNHRSKDEAAVGWWLAHLTNVEGLMIRMTSRAHHTPSAFASSSTVVTGAWQVKFWQT